MTGPIRKTDDISRTDGGARLGLDVILTVVKDIIQKFGSLAFIWDFYRSYLFSSAECPHFHIEAHGITPMPFPAFSVLHLTT